MPTQEQSADQFLRFDSKLVRLKENSASSYTLRVTGFDSKLVRLKAGKTFTAGTRVLEFRFQTGSIKRMLIAEHGLLNVPSFDSKLVRLKGHHLQTALVALKKVSIPNWFD